MNPTCLTSKLIIALLLVFPSALAAQTCENCFDSRAEWDGARCGTLVEDEIAASVDGNTGFFPLPNGIDLGWGTLTSFGFQDNSFFNLPTNLELPQGFIINKREFTGTGDLDRTFYLDLKPTLLTTLGPVEGFCFRYSSEGFNIDLYDGTTLVKPLHAPSSGTTEVADFGWINADGLDITRVEIYSYPDDGDTNNTEWNPVTLISSIDFSFGEYCPPGESLFDQLTDLRDDVANLLAEESGSDAFFLTRALNRINRMQNGFLWENDNRLSQNGSNLFLNAAGAIVFLQRTRNPQADAIIDDLLSTLGSIVDAEIAYATANDGTPSLIARAESFANLADSIRNPVVAALTYRQAWASAYAATN